MISQFRMTNEHLIQRCAPPSPQGEGIRKSTQLTSVILEICLIGVEEVTLAPPIGDTSLG